MARAKPAFAAVPMRAIGDDRLAAVDLRVLMVIAAHDRFAANGVGCYASHSRIAALAACHIKSLSRSLRILADYGYIVGRNNPLNQRTRIYNVVYTDFDGAYLKSGGTEMGNEPVTIPSRKGNEFAVPIGQIGNKVLEETRRKQGSSPVNILCETSIDPGEPESRNSAEAASTGQRTALEPSAIAILGMIERGIRNGTMTAGKGRRWHKWLNDQISDGGLEYTSPEYVWAFRLHENLGAQLGKAA